MENEEYIEEKELPKIVTILVGIVLLPLTLICVIGSLVIILDPQVDNLPLTLGLGSVFLFGSLFGVLKSFQMIFCIKQKTGGLLSPVALRFLSIVLLIIPVVSVVSGTFMEAPYTRSIQTVVYVLAFLGLNKLATVRSKNANTST